MLTLGEFPALCTPLIHLAEVLTPQSAAELMLKCYLLRLGDHVQHALVRPLF